MNGVKGEFQTIGNAELIENVMEMVLYGLLSDEHLLGNFFVLVALGN